MRPLSELRQLATEERRLARRPQVIELLDALLDLTSAACKLANATSLEIECPSCTARREAKRVAQAKWRRKGQT